MAQVDASKLLDSARTLLKDATLFAVFDAQDNVLASNFQVDTAELKPVAAVFEDRDEAIKLGIHLQGKRYEVHRHHPPLVYGRTMGGTPESSEGIALCKVEGGADGAATYFGLITYSMPNVSARMVPLLQTFCQQNLAAGGAPVAAGSS